MDLVGRGNSTDFAGGLGWVGTELEGSGGSRDGECGERQLVFWGGDGNLVQWKLSVI